MKSPVGFGLIVCAALLQGCSSPPPPSASAPRSTPVTATAGAGIRLTATLSTPTDVDLRWTDPAPGAGGHIVEFATEPEGEYTILGFVVPEVTSFRHPDLMPDTTFYYRVRAYYGPVSNAVEIVLPASLSDKTYAEGFKKDEDYSWAEPRTEPPKVPVRAESIRGGGQGVGVGAPTDLSGTLVPSTISGFKLTWTDRSSDEEGFYLETQPASGGPFTVIAVTEPNINVFGFALNPPERKASFRVRAFYYGPASNVESRKTGPEPASSSPAGK